MICSINAPGVPSDARSLLERAQALFEQAEEFHELSYRIGGETDLTDPEDMRRCQALLSEFVAMGDDIKRALTPKHT